MQFTSRLLAALFAVLLAASAHAAQGDAQTYMLEGVGDGDTIYVRANDGKTSYRVRLAMIDAPEKTQDYGMNSRSALMQLLRGAGSVTVISYGYDRYGRIIGVVFNNGRNINLELVQQGAAWVYEQYASRPEYAEYKSQLDSAQYYAQVQRLGLWNSSNPVAPWKFRRN